MVLFLPSCVLLCSNEDYLVLYCLFQIRFYPFFIANSQGKQSDSYKQTALLNLKLFPCSIAICMELILRLVSLHSSLFGLLPLWLDHVDRHGVILLSVSAHRYIKSVEKQMWSHGLSGNYRLLEHWWYHPISLLDLYKVL